MSTTIENTTAAPAIEVPPKNETPAIINVEDHPVNTETTTPVITDAPAAVKVTPTQRLNSVFIKAKQTVTDVVSEAQKALNERKTNATTAATTADVAPTTTTTSTAPDAVTSDIANKKEGGPNYTFKDILNRVKGLKPTSTHPAVVETVSANQETAKINSGAPVPPPKDNGKPTTSNTSTNPVLEQFKRNTALLTNYLLQKKKEFTEKKSSDEHQQTTTPELHGETATAPTPAPTTAHTTEKPASAGSPLVRRITQLVNNATASINKKREPKKKEETTTVAEPTIIVNDSPAVVTGSA